jgi:colicin import membrane protein
MQRRSDHWISLALSVLLHAALVAALVYGWLLFRHPPRPKPTLAIEATVVDARALREAQRPAPQPPAPVAPPPQPAQPPPPPQPTPEELAQREAQREEQRAQAAQEEQAAERAAAEEAARAKLEEQRKAEERKAEERRKAEAERKTQAAALAAQHAADTQEQNALEADLKRSLAAEEHATRSAPALANWQAQITAKISREWQRPPTARAGIECVLNVTQVPGGEVTSVSIGECNGDQAVRESIERAVYRASPLPPPPDPALFERNLKINFKPD